MRPLTCWTPHENSCKYLKIGVKEARDQVETALYLGKQAYVDKDRIGIWGWSYGGSVSYTHLDVYKRQLYLLCFPYRSYFVL